jgi:CHAT domain-containing protein/tetratricopeptide (TPR) repeat protein
MRWDGIGVFAAALSLLTALWPRAILAQGKDGRDVGKALALARQLAGQGRDEDALKVYAEVLSPNNVKPPAKPWVVQALFERGPLLIGLGQYRAAAADFEAIGHLVQGDDPTSRYFRYVAGTNYVLCRHEMDWTSAVAERVYVPLITATRELANDEQAGDEVRVASAKLLGIQYYLLAAIYNEALQADAALDTVEKSLKLIVDNEWTWRAKALRLKGEILAGGLNPEEGLKTLYQAKTLFEAHGLTTELPEVLSKILAHEHDAEAQRRVFGELEALELKPGSFHEGQRLLWLAELEFKLRQDPTASRKWLEVYTKEGYGARFPRLLAWADMLSAYLALAENKPDLVAKQIGALERLEKDGRLQEYHQVELADLKLNLAILRDDPLAALEQTDRLREMMFSRNQSSGPIRAFPISRQAAVLADMGRAMYQVGRYDLAIMYFRRAVTLFEELHNSREATRAKLGYAQCWEQTDPLGRDETGAGPPEWRRTLGAIDPKQLPRDDRRLYEIIYMDGLMKLGASGDESSMREARARLERLKADPALGADPHLLQAEITLALRAGRIADAEALFLKLKASTQSQRAWEPDLLALEAELHRVRDRLEPALELFRESARLIDDRSRASPVLAYQAAIRDDRRLPFDRAVDVALSLAKRDPARFCDTAAECILEAIVPPSPPSRIPRSARLEDILSSMAATRILAQIKSASWWEDRCIQVFGVSKDRLLESRTTAFQRDYGAYLGLFPINRQIAAAANRGAELLAAVKERSRRFGRQTRIYFVGIRSGALVVVAPNGQVTAHQLPADAVGRLRQNVAGWNREINRQNIDEPLVRQLLLDSSPSLFPDGVPRDPIELLLHDFLWNVSFEALPVADPAGGKPAYLDDVCDISYLLPSTLSRADADQENATAAIAQGAGYVFVGPDNETPEWLWRIKPVANQNERVPDVKQTDIYFEPVLATEAERKEAQVGSGESLWRAISESLPRASSPVIERRFREEDVFDPKVADARWLHFNGHGVRENEWERRVAIVLNASLVPVRPQDGERHFRGPDYRGDGWLTPREIETLSLRAEFIFLHGCDTLAGDPSFSAGPLGLISSFRATGAGLVIGTHWKVSDHATIQQEIGRFYERVRSTSSSIQGSLRQLRHSLRESGRSTRDWAAFSVYR